MSQFLLEILTEEIPARMHKKAQADVCVHLSTLLEAAELSFSTIETFITPRRLVAVVEGLPLSSCEKTEEKRGPKISAPAQAFSGFLKSLSITQGECEQRDEYWYATSITPAQPTSIILMSVLQDLFRVFSWPKSMRWPGAAIPWVRPIRSVLAIFNGTPLFCDLPDLGLKTVDTTVDHRFFSSSEKKVTDARSYKEALTHVVLSSEDRKHTILEGLKESGRKLGYTLIENEKLLEEVAGLVEYPVPLIGHIDSAFMSLPAEVLMTSMRVHQKYFSFSMPSGDLAPVFGFVANRPVHNDWMQQGYEKVLRARLSDAEFFYKQDQEQPLERFNSALEKIIFHAKLGTVFQRVERLERSVTLPEAKRAARLCKADLVSSMVLEFPELQGIMGAIYARHYKETPAVCDAIREHYAPQGPHDFCPRAPASVALALAEKMDTLVGFFGIGEPPTGSKDPYALRRSALGIVRLMRENPSQSVDIRSLARRAFSVFNAQDMLISADKTVDRVVDFILERLAQALKAEGVSPACVAATVGSLAPDAPIDLVALSERAHALNAFLNTLEGSAFLDAFRRVQGVLTPGNSTIINPDLFESEAEKKLFNDLKILSGQVSVALEERDYAKALSALSPLKQHIDDFFTLRIHDDCESVRANRLGLLRQFSNCVLLIADFNRL